MYAVLGSDNLNISVSCVSIAAVSVIAVTVRASVGGVSFRESGNSYVEWGHSTVDTSRKRRIYICSVSHIAPITIMYVFVLIHGMLSLLLSSVAQTGC